MNIKSKPFASILLVLIFCLSGCVNSNYNVTDEDFVGWWSFDWRETGVEADPPFFYTLIDANGNVQYFDEEGLKHGSGTLGYNDENELHFITQYGTEHTVYLGEEDGVRYIALSSTDRFTYSEEKPEIVVFDTPSHPKAT